ncbi:MAG: 30S ribosomal protein S6 [Kiloniellaceae bacterium]
MALYECVFIARQDISATQVEGLVERFTGIIEAGGGRVAKKEMWGLRNLAYRIKKNRKGHYALLNIEAPSEAVKEMERNMRLHDDVLRYLTVRVAKLEEGPSVVMQARAGRDERGGRDGRRDGRGPRGEGRDRGPPRPRGGTAEKAEGEAKTEEAKA